MRHPGSPLLIMLLVVVAALGAVVAPPAHADVYWSVPFAARVAAAQVIGVARVSRVEGKGPFTVAHPPAVTLTVTRAIRGCRAGEKLRLPDYGTENAPWANVQDPPRPADQAIAPPALGSELLVLLPKALGASLRGNDRALYGPPPDPKQVELAATLATFHFDSPGNEVIRSVVGGPVPVKITITNDTAAPAVFELAGVHLSTRSPGAGDDLNASLTAQRVAFKPKEARALEWDLAVLAPALFPAPGDYSIRVELPAAGPGDFIDLHVERVERSLAFLCGRAEVIVRARVEVTTDGKAALADVIPLRGDPAAVKSPAAVPAWTQPPATGQRAILCWHDGQAEWVETQTPALADAVARLVDGDSAPLAPDPRFAPKEALPASELHKLEVRLRLAAP